MGHKQKVGKEKSSELKLKKTIDKKKKHKDKSHHHSRDRTQSSSKYRDKSPALSSKTTESGSGTEEDPDTRTTSQTRPNAQTSTPNTLHAFSGSLTLKDIANEIVAVGEFPIGLYAWPFINAVISFCEDVRPENWHKLMSQDVLDKPQTHAERTKFGEHYKTAIIKAVEDKNENPTGLHPLSAKGAILLTREPTTPSMFGNFSKGVVSAISFVDPPKANVLGKNKLCYITCSLMVKLYDTRALATARENQFPSRAQRLNILGEEIINRYQIHKTETGHWKKVIILKEGYLKNFPRAICEGSKRHVVHGQDEYVTDEEGLSLNVNPEPLQVSKMSCLSSNTNDLLKEKTIEIYDIDQLEQKLLRQLEEIKSKKQRKQKELENLTKLKAMEDENALIIENFRRKFGENEIMMMVPEIDKICSLALLLRKETGNLTLFDSLYSILPADFQQKYEKDLTDIRNKEFAAAPQINEPLADDSDVEDENPEDTFENRLELSNYVGTTPAEGDILNEHDYMSQNVASEVEVGSTKDDEMDPGDDSISVKTTPRDGDTSSQAGFQQNYEDLQNM